MTFRVGVVGAGYMANHYLKLFHDSELYTTVGVVSRTESRAQLLAEKFVGTAVYRSIGEMYKAVSPDVVIVAVSILETLEVLHEIWKYPWTCMVEKPAGHNLSEAKKILADSKSSSGATFLALNRRYYESVQEAKALISSHEGPRFIQLHDQHDTHLAREAGAPSEVVKNWQFANAIHTVDLGHFFARGEIDNVTSSAWKSVANSFVVESRVDYSTGDRIAYTSYWNMPQNWSLSISTPDTRLVLSPLEELYMQTRGDRYLKKADLKGKDLDFKPGLFALVGNLTQYLEGQSNNLVSLGEGVASMNLIDRIFRGASTLIKGLGE